ncbi:MAG: hypothetical protein HOL31_01915 [Candidatus Scalindua sp.]|jgi:hypothetical protein|nr:hypothetical protein [Candidatus Scalindua sp.]
MTVTNKTNTVEEAGNGSKTAFTFDFPAQATTDIEVYEVDTTTLAATLLTVTTHYTTALNATTEGGTVTYVTAPASGKNSFIKRVMDLDQQTAVPTEGNIPEASLNNEFDKSRMIDIQQQDELDRSPKFATTSTLSDFTMPEGTSAADRATKVIAYDSAGTAMTLGVGIGTYTGDWATATAYAVRDLVKDTSNENIYYCNTAHTSTGAQPISSNADVAKWDLIVDAAAAGASATAAASSASAAAADAVSTAADVVSTNADVVSTNADVVSTAADVATVESAVGAVSFKFTFSDTTTMADPGVGIMRFNNSTVSSVTAIAFDSTSADTGNPDISDYIASWDDGSNSTHEGYITIKKSGAPATFAIFAITGGVTDSSGWLQATVTHTDSNGSISDADTLYISYARSGDKGATGSTGSTGATGAPNGLPMAFEDTTTDTDQGAGKVWLNNATISSATVFYVDDVDSNAANINSFVDTWDDSTNSTLRGTITMTKSTDVSVWAIFSVSGAVTSASTYSKVAVTYVDHSGAFTDADVVAVQFVRTGNQGGGLADIVDDTTPQLGGNLDVNSNGITWPSAITVTDVLDEDAMGSDSAVKLATQQSIKKYVDTRVRIVVLTAFAPTTDTATGDDKVHLHIPASMNGMNLTSVHSELITAGTTGTTDIQVRNVTQAANMLSTEITIDSGETGSDTAVTPAVIDTSNDHVATNDLISIDVDAVSTTAGKGLVNTLEFTLP